MWVSSRTTQGLFEAVCEIPNLQGLFIEWGRITDLSPLLRSTHLQYLHIGSAPGARQVECLADLHNLIVLEIEHIPALHSLAPVAHLTQLQGLAVIGSTWSTQVVASLAPLRSLTNLKYLFLENLRAEDGSLAPLCHLTSPVNLRTAYWWPLYDFRLLAECLPNIRYGSLLQHDLIDRFAGR